MNLTQMLVTQQNVDEISARFGLTEEQTLEAMNAVLPAFSEGLKRQTNSPGGAADFLMALANGNHQQYADQPSMAMDSAGVSEGNAILGHLFGSKDVSRAVAKHAAASTGISDSMFKELLPALASMIMGALFKGMTGGGSSRSGGGALGGIGDILGEVLTGGLSGGSGSGGAAGGGLLGQILEGLAGGMVNGAGQGTRRRRSSTTRRRRGSSGLPGMFEDLIGDALAGGQRAPQRSRRTRKAPKRRSRQTTSSNGLEGLLEDFLTGGQGKRRRSTRRKSTTSRRSKTRTNHSRQGGGLGEIFGDFLDAGGNTSSRQQREAGSIFDQFLGG